MHIKGLLETEYGSSKLTSKQQSQILKELNFDLSDVPNVKTWEKHVQVDIKTDRSRIVAPKAIQKQKQKHKYSVDKVSDRSNNSNKSRTKALNTSLKVQTKRERFQSSIKSRQLSNVKFSCYSCLT